MSLVNNFAQKCNFVNTMHRKNGLVKNLAIEKLLKILFSIIWKAFMVVNM